MRFPRASGVLLHPTSLPGPHGSGDLGPEAYHFVDWLVASGQKLWQVLPLAGIGQGTLDVQLFDDLRRHWSAEDFNVRKCAPEQRCETRACLKYAARGARGDAGHQAREDDLIAHTLFAPQQNALAGEVFAFPQRQTVTGDAVRFGESLEAPDIVAPPFGETSRHERRFGA